MDFLDDSEIFKNARQKIGHFRDVSILGISNMDVVQRLVIFYDRSKNRGDKEIHRKLIETDGVEAYTLGSVKYWAHEYEGGRRDPTDSPRAERQVSDFAQAISKVLNEQPFSSARYIAAQLRTSRNLVKRTLVEVLGMQKFSLRWVPRKLTVAQKGQRVADSRILPQALRADAANEFANIITADESWYY
jgi:hypothetical protein